VTVLVLTWPMWTSTGGGLARDLVFTPRHPWNLDAIGMGTAQPRAVPLDGVLALATSLVDGAVVFRIAVAGVLLLAGAGAHRLLPDLPPAVRCVAAVAAVWNPYVVERLALGQWALLAGYAALWWLLPAVRRALNGEPRAWPAVVGWLWLGSLTPSGGAALVLVALCVTVCSLISRSSAGSRRAALLLPVVALAGQLPWVLAGLLGPGAGPSDPAGVDAFAARAERAGGVWPTLLGTGGTWSPFVVPHSLTGWTGWALTLVVLVVLVVGGRSVARRWPGLVVAAAIGFLLAGLAHLPGGSELLDWAVAHVPGSGLLRDGQKWLLPFVVVVVASAATSVSAAVVQLRRRDADLARLLPAALVVLPVVLLPDAAGATWDSLTPVRYPDELAAAVAVLDRAAAASGDVVTLPWSSYRRFSWGNPLSAADPLPRWTRHRAVVSDALAVPGGVVTGEDARATAVGEVVADSSRPVADALARLGVGWVLVYRDQPAADALDTDGLTAEVTGPDVTLYRVTAADVTALPPVRRPVAVGVVVAADLLWLVAGLGAGVTAFVLHSRAGPDGRRRRRSQRA
jgi:hypothetical protein